MKNRREMPGIFKDLNPVRASLCTHQSCLTTRSEAMAAMTRLHVWLSAALLSAALLSLAQD